MRMPKVRGLTCPECHGTGFVAVTRGREGGMPPTRHLVGFDDAGHVRCQRCGGKGVLPEEPIVKEGLEGSFSRTDVHALTSERKPNLSK